MITCPCPKMYIGKTKNTLKIRIGEHLRDIRKEKKRDPEKGQEKPVAKHFADFHEGKNGWPKSKRDLQYILKLPPRRGDFNRILLQKKVVDIHVEVSHVPGP